MARKFPLQPLQELAQNNLDTAERHLQKLADQTRQAEEKLQQLEGFRGEYQQRLQQSTAQGMHALMWRDYQAFLGKLDAAIAQQSQEVERCRARWEAGRQQWLARRQRSRAFDTLAERHQSAENQREDRREQKETDEFAAKSHARRKPDPGH